MNQLTKDKRAMIVNLLCEGNSIRATSRLTGASKNTIQKLQADLGAACSKYQDEAFVNLKCQRLQCDEIWSFCYGKDKNLPKHLKDKPGFGSVWTWTCICADSKAIISWFVGDRSASSAYHFMHDIQPRLASRVQLTTDGHRAYLSAVEDAFGAEVDYGMLVKLYSETVDGNGPERKYSPGVCMGARKTFITGQPSYKHISTSYAEKMNQTIRQSMRRFTRLSNGHSKKLENHERALAIFFMFYNFCRINAAHRVTPAMELGIADHVWSVEEVPVPGFEVDNSFGRNLVNRFSVHRLSFSCIHKLSHSPLKLAGLDAGEFQLGIAQFLNDFRRNRVAEFVLSQVVPIVVGLCDRISRPGLRQFARGLLGEGE